MKPVPTSRIQRYAKNAAVVAVVAIVGAVAIGIQSDLSGRSQPSSGMNVRKNVASGQYRIAKPYFGCVSKDTFAEADRRAMRMARQGDMMAAQMAANSAIATGQCATLEEGTIVNWEDRSYGGLACLRPRGYDVCLWTSPEIVDIR